MTQQRDAIKEISPPWLSTGNAERLLYDFGLGADVLLEKLNQAVRAHMPGAGTASALVYIGNDRVISQGPYESDDDYAIRLQTAFEAWQRAGARRAILSQVVRYLSSPAFNPASPVPVAAIVGGRWPTWDVYYSQDNVENPPAHIFASGSFNWDNIPLTTRWWRAWLVLYFTLQATGKTGGAASVTGASGGFVTLTGLSGIAAANVGDMITITGALSSGNNGTFRIEQFVSSSSVVISNTLGTSPDGNNTHITWTVQHYPTVGPGPAWTAPGAVWGDPTRSWGLNVPPGVMSGVTEILNEWKRASTFYPETLIVFGGGDGTAGNEESPYSTPGAGNPDGTWGQFSKIVGGVSVPARVTAGVFGRFHAFSTGSR